MAKLVKYFVTQSGSNFAAFDLDYSNLSLRGTEVTYDGTSGIESVYVTRGINFSFSQASGSTDKIYLRLPLSSYTRTIDGSNLILTESETGAQVVVASGSSFSSDRVIFTDGYISSYSLSATPIGSTPVLNPNERTPDNKNDLISAFTGSSPSVLKAFAISAEGGVFATVPIPSTSMVVSGTSGVDKVYVSRGANVDATALSGGTDEIYFTGRVSDYTRVIDGSNLILTRTVDGNTEKVTVAIGSVFSSDRLIFADGYVRSVDLGAKTADSTLSLTINNSIRTPGLSPELNVSTLDGQLSLDVSSNIVLSFSEEIEFIAGGQIKIINDANDAAGSVNRKTGYFGENVTNSFTFDIPSSGSPGTTVSVADGSLSLAGNKLTINPIRDLDFSNNYHIEITGATLRGKATQVNFAGITNSTSLNFSTVTPSSAQSISDIQGASKKIGSDGQLSDSFVWMDVDNWGSKGNQTAIALDLSNKKIALVTPDKLAQASELILAPGGTDYSVAQARVSTGNFNLALSNFGADDLLYVDDLGRQPPENFAQTMQLIFNIQRSDSTQNNNTTFFFDPIDQSLGGQILIVGQNFATIEEWTRELSGSQAPFVFGSS